MKTLHRALAILGFIGMTLSSSGLASAQQSCVTHEAATKQLEEKFDERVVGRGLANAGKAMFELFVSEKGSLTVVVSEPSGRSCILASGESWRQQSLLIGDPA